MDLLITQLVCAFAPGVIGLVVAAVLSPRMFRFIAKVFQFDLTTVLLLMTACAVLFAMNRAMLESEQQAWQEYLKQQASDEYAYPSALRISGFQNAMLTLTCIFTLPCVIFARLLIDGYRDERRSRAERKQRQSELDLQAALAPKPVWIDAEPEKPQWID